MTHAGHARAILRLGLPLIGSHVAQFGIVLTDALMLGWYDVETLAAQVIGGTFWFVFFIVASGFAWGIVPMVAAAAARGEQVQIRRVTRMCMWLSLMAAAAAMPFLLSTERLLLLMGQVPGTAELAGQYQDIAGWSIFPALLVMVLKSYLSALERTRVVLWATLAAVGVNAAINYALIFGHFGAPEMGIRGAAVATLAVNLVIGGLLALYAVRAMPHHQLFVRFWRPDPEAFGRVFRLGWPIGLTSLAEAGLFTASSLMMGWLGTVPLAAHGIALQIASIAFMVHLGLSNAATVRAGNAMGRGDALGLRRGALVATAMSVGAALVTVTVMLSLPELLIGAFIDPADPAHDEVLATGVLLLVAAAFFQLADGGQVMALGLLRGIQDTRVPMWMAGVSYWVLGVPASYVLAFRLGWGGIGLWVGLALGLALAWLLLSWRFWTWGVRRPMGPQARRAVSG